MPKRLEFIAEELQPNRPRARQRVDIQNPASQGDLSFLSDLRFRLIALLLQPLDQVQRINTVSSRKQSDATAQTSRGKSPLKQSRNTSDNDRRFSALAPP